MKISFNWIKLYIPDLPDANLLQRVFTYHLTEVENLEEKNNDYIFDLNILPNRAHDLLSHQGVAREIASQLGLKFNIKNYEPIIGEKTNLKIEINTNMCRRFSARIIRNIKVGPSPKWMVDYLESIGERSINNIVDATNIVMYDCGQPMHAFDLRQIKNEKIIISNLDKEEELKLVGKDGSIAKLKPFDVVIKDGNGDTLSLAGIKGGVNSGILDDTKDIVLEVANFNPVAIRKTARRISVLSDAAKRFENDINPEHVEYAMSEISALIFELFPDAIFEEIVDIYTEKDKWKEDRKISFSVSILNKKIGSSITKEEVEEILKKYNYEYSVHGEVFEIIVPKLRLDLLCAEDMVEEIIRIYGYDKVLPVMPKFSILPKENDLYKNINLARAKLLSDGYREVFTYTFSDKGDIEVLNSASDKNFLRKNLLDGLKKSYELNKLNSPLFGIDKKDLKIFEIDKVFTKEGEMIKVAFVDKNGANESDLLDFVKNIDDINLGIKEYVLDKDLFKMWSIYPFIVRDLSLWVNSDNDKEIVFDILKKEGGEFLSSMPRLVDRFVKDEKISLSFRMIFQSYEKTLIDEDINKIMDKISKQLLEKGFVLR